jgi:hypothetical protein
MPQKKQAKETQMYQTPAGISKITEEMKSAFRKEVERHFRGTKALQTEDNKKTFYRLFKTAKSTPAIMPRRHSPQIYYSPKSWVSGREVSSDTEYISLKPSRGRKRTILKIK